MLLDVDTPISGYSRFNYKCRAKVEYHVGVQFQDCSFPSGLKCKDIILFFIDIYNLHISNKDFISSK